MIAHRRALKKLGFKGDISHLKRLEDYAHSISDIINNCPPEQREGLNRAEYILEQIARLFEKIPDGFYIDTQARYSLKIKQKQAIAGLERDLLGNAILCPEEL